MADIGNQFEGEMGKLTEQVTKLVASLNSLTSTTVKDNAEAMSQLRKQIRLCTEELLNMESVAGSNNTALTGLRGQVNEAAKKYNDLMAANGENAVYLSQIADESNDTGEKIGEMLKTERMSLDHTASMNKNISTVVEQNKVTATAAAEAVREGKRGGKAGAEHLGRNEKKEKAGKGHKEGHGGHGGEAGLYAASINLLKSMKGLPKAFEKIVMFIPRLLMSAWGQLGAAIALVSGFTIGFMTTAIKSYATVLANGYKAMLRGGEMLYNGFDFILVQLRRFGGPWKEMIPTMRDIARFPKAVFKTFMETFPLADKMKATVMYIGNIFKGIATKLEPVFSFIKPLVTKFKSFVSNNGPLYYFMTAIEKVFGKGALNIFGAAMEWGAKFAKFLPLLSIIPTTIETIVAAFKNYKTEGLKGVLKTILVGLLKGVAAFFTLGLSDLALDFDNMFNALTKPLDGLFTQLMGIVDIFGDVFKWLFGTVSELWEDVLKPITMSIWENVLKPVMDVLQAVGNFVTKVVAVILALLSPIFAVIKVILKLVFEMVKILYDYVIHPILKMLVPVFTVVFSVIGFFFGLIRDGFNELSSFFDGILEFMNSPDGIVAEFTKWCDGLVEMFGYLSQGFKEGVVDPVKFVFTMIGELITSVWQGIKSSLGTVASLLGINLDEKKPTAKPMATEDAKIAAVKKNAAVASPELSANQIASSTPTTVPARQMRSATAGTSVAQSTIVVNNAPTTNNVSNGGGGGGAPIVFAPNPVRHADPTRAMIAT